jgi:hypothetical protein
MNPAPPPAEGPAWATPSSAGLRHASQRGGLLGCLLGCWLGAALPVLASATPQPAAHLLAQSQLDVSGVLYGILRYTTWPAPTDPLRLCISRSAPGAEEIKRQLPGTVRGHTLAVLLIDATDRSTDYCDAVYLDGWPAETVRAKLRALAGQPVLTLGRGADFCTDGGMFCLQAQVGVTRFEVNLNAVSLSGLRVAPQVLRLARPAPKGAT